MFRVIYKIFLQLLNSIKKPKSEPPFIIQEEKPLSPVEVNTQVRSKYKKGWIQKVRKKPITEVVIHGTAGGSSTTGLLRWMYNGERARDYRRGISLFHYAIGVKGDIVEVIDPEFWVHHSSCGRHDKVTIGIELLNPSKDNSKKYSEFQYASLHSLIFDRLLKLYPSITRIVSHNFNQKYYSGYGKQCPGKGFNWDVIKKELSRRKIKYTYHNETFTLTKGV